MHKFGFFVWFGFARILKFETKLKVPITNQRSLTTSTHTNPPPPPPVTSLPQAQTHITPTNNAMRKDKWGAQTIKIPHLCQWNTTPTATKWVEASQLLHIDNITLKHNLLLLHKFTQNVYTKTTLAIHKSCINFS